MTQAEKIIATAKAEVGNGGTKYRKWFYGSEQRGVAWCAIFVSWVFSQAGVSMYKTDGAGCFARNGQYGKWYESEYSNSSTTPKKGDIITFVWNYAGRYSNQDKYYSDHVGIVYAVDNNYVYTIEGNSGSSNDTSSVKLKSYNRTSGCINGYYRPNYSNTTTESEEEKMNNFCKGDKGDGVLAYKSLLIQARLLGLITTKVDNSNSFGNGTYKATVEVQKKYKLEVDGVAGKNTITALNKAITERFTQIYKFTTMAEGDWNLGVASLKAMCEFAKELGLITASVDAKLGYGDGTAKAIKQIQALIGEKETGIATEYTIKQFKVIAKNALQNKLSK